MFYNSFAVNLSKHSQLPFSLVTCHKTTFSATCFLVSINCSYLIFFQITLKRKHHLTVFGIQPNPIFISAFLVSELEASRMILVNKPEKNSLESGSPVFQELKGICMALGMSKPPANITMFQFFSGIEKKVSWSIDTERWCVLTG